MSVKSRLISWNPAKKAYGTALAAGLAVYLGLFVGIGFQTLGVLHSEVHPVLALATGAGMAWLLEACRIDAGPVDAIQDDRARYFGTTESSRPFRTSAASSAATICTTSTSPRSCRLPHDSPTR